LGGSLGLARKRINRPAGSRQVFFAKAVLEILEPLVGVGRCCVGTWLRGSAALPSYLCGYSLALSGREFLFVSQRLLCASGSVRHSSSHTVAEKPGSERFAW